MSDIQQEPDWWLGTDGKWYPPAAPVSETLPLPPVSAVPPIQKSNSGRKKAVAGAVIVVVLFGAFSALGVGPLGGPSVEEKYVAALDDAGLNEWATQRAAINAGTQVCEKLDKGEPAQGSQRDAIAVEFLCPDYSKAFRVLSQEDFVGSFTVKDSDFRFFSEGTPCTTSGGYSDVNSSTQVVVLNGSGDQLARTSLGRGRANGDGGCEFVFTVSLTEGEEVYIVEVGRRGQISYTWSELGLLGGFTLTLGS